ncbi:penicillin-binding protein 2 [Mucilaginibacter gracilis]|uniref:Penicillin-binding protein 2 n=1 Tax=Mucilaginibacter gracilis TaxID=423350 RepID=A0A495J983_9SPHI|nr:penicillin-binding protein 2 [Mucilaginibacter gracilis]RKR85565.1 penicillin-binding protein 2 [Mucilaginibacter gracilis]
MNNFFERRYVIQGIFICMAVALLGRLFYIQLVDDQYTVSANRNVKKTFILFPSRGEIFDRKGKVLVQNEPVYDIMVTPREVKPFDTLKLCQLLGIDKAGVEKRLRKALIYSRSLASAFEKQLPLKSYTAFSELSYEFPGFVGVQRSVRTYPDSVAAQFLGFIDEVTDNDIKKSHGYYKRGDYIGRTGVEKAYEDSLRGQRGVKTALVDSKGVVKEKFLNGLEDTAMVAGDPLISSLDIDIQKLGEKLMKNKVGSIVAIEPSTGEILCFVSSPGYDPNLMVGRERGNNAAELYKNPYNPFFIRPIQAYYPPGSSFKPLDALIALQSGLIKPQTTFTCTGIYWAGNQGVHCDEVHGVCDLSRAIAQSCNTYFDNVFEKLMNVNGPKSIESTFADWRAKVNKFGFGVRLGVDMPHEKWGNVPTNAQYDKRFGVNRWRSSSIISLGIGQGELLATPLQLANIECIIANHGYYYKPHLIKSIGNRAVIKKDFTQKISVGIDDQYFEPVINGMQQVVERGTAAASRIPGIVMCGKTGTAQNPHGKNHSIFVAFAPRDHPRIAIAVVVENAGQGAWWAAPIASYIVEKYLRDSLTSRASGKTPQWIMDQNLLPALKTDVAAAKQKAVADSVKSVKKDSIKQIKSAARGNKHNQQQLVAIQFRRKENE